MTAEVNCPNCGKNVVWDASQKWKPFCSERCKLIDLGEWASESHRIAGEPVYSPSDDSLSEDYH
jgi:hypothetical protein